MINAKLLAIDIAKTTFQLNATDERGKTILKKRLSRAKLSNFIGNFPVCTIVMESCGGANYWARQWRKLGHEVKLISPQYVKPFVKGNKTDNNDAQAIAEAASRPTMRYVCIKTVEQQDIQSLHRIRERLISNRVALMNQIRGLLMEYGLVIPKGERALNRLLPEFLEDAENELTMLTRTLIDELRSELCDLNQRIHECDKKIQQLFSANETCQRIAQVEGVGPITATAIVSDLGEPRHFKNGRHYAAYLGLVPRQASSGDKTRLLGISKRGDKYLRKLLIHGARSVVAAAAKKKDKKSLWLNELRNRCGINKTCVALANKNARTLWSLIANSSIYQVAG